MKITVALKDGTKFAGNDQVALDILIKNGGVTDYNCEDLYGTASTMMKDVAEFDFTGFRLDVGTARMYFPKENINYIQVDGGQEFLNQIIDIKKVNGWT